MSGWKRGKCHCALLEDAFVALIALFIAFSITIIKILEDFLQYASSLSLLKNTVTEIYLRSILLLAKTIRKVLASKRVGFEYSSDMKRLTFSLSVGKSS